KKIYNIIANYMLRNGIDVWDFTLWYLCGIFVVSGQTHRSAPTRYHGIHSRSAPTMYQGIHSRSAPTPYSPLGRG
ncbi:hypothetical protein KKG56_10845, partial [bacterium]|nr:hypothetical protein [bacterium]